MSRPVRGGRAVRPVVTYNANRRATIHAHGDDVARLDALCVVLNRSRGEILSLATSALAHACGELRELEVEQMRRTLVRRSRP